MGLSLEGKALQVFVDLQPGKQASWPDLKEVQRFGQKLFPDDARDKLASRAGVAVDALGPSPSTDQGNRNVSGMFQPHSGNPVHILTSRRQPDWDLYLSLVLCAYRTTVQESTKCTPAALMLMLSVSCVMAGVVSLCVGICVTLAL